MAKPVPSTYRVRNTGTTAVASAVTGVGPPFTSYSPIVRFSSDQTAAGINSRGVWRRDGAWVDIDLEWDITGAYNVGILVFSLPISVAEIGMNCGQVIGGCLMVKQGYARRVGTIFTEGGLTNVGLIDCQGGGPNYTDVNLRVSNDTPWVWAVQDSGVATMRYRGV